MTNLGRQVRGAVGTGILWGAAWGGVGAIMVLGIVLAVGHRPDPPFPLMFTAFGFVTGAVFYGLAGLVESRRRFDELSMPRFAMFGAAAGFLLSTVFVLTVALAGDPAFSSNLLALVPVFAVAAAGSAAGSLILARRSQRCRRLLAGLGAEPESISGRM